MIQGRGNIDWGTGQTDRCGYNECIAFVVKRAAVVDRNEGQSNGGQVNLIGPP